MRAAAALMRHAAPHEPPAAARLAQAGRSAVRRGRLDLDRQASGCSTSSTITEIRRSRLRQRSTRPVRIARDAARVVSSMAGMSAGVAPSRDRVGAVRFVARVECLDLGDRVGMASSVEARVPLLEAGVIDTAIGLWRAGRRDDAGLGRGCARSPRLLAGQYHTAQAGLRIADGRVDAGGERAILAARVRRRAREGARDRSTCARGCSGRPVGATFDVCHAARGVVPQRQHLFIRGLRPRLHSLARRFASALRRRSSFIARSLGQEHRRLL